VRASLSGSSGIVVFTQPLARNGCFSVSLILAVRPYVTIYIYIYIYIYMCVGVCVCVCVGDIFINMSVQKSLLYNLGTIFLT
jgi:hypothetical protein